MKAAITKELTNADDGGVDATFVDSSNVEKLAERVGREKTRSFSCSSIDISGMKNAAYLWMHLRDSKVVSRLVLKKFIYTPLTFVLNGNIPQQSA